MCVCVLLLHIMSSYTFININQQRKVSLISILSYPIRSVFEKSLSSYLIPTIHTTIGAKNCFLYERFNNNAVLFIRNYL